MHASLFDSYQAHESLIHSLDARVKILMAIGLILGTVLLPDGAWMGFGLTWFLILLISRAARVKIRFLLTRSLLFIPFVLAAATVIFTLPGVIIWSVQIGPVYIQASDFGLLRFSSIVLRSWLSVQVAVLLVVTTRFPDLIHALEHLKVPNVIISIISFMYRYLFVLFDETMRLVRARQARSAVVSGFKSGGSLSWRARTAGNMAGQLFVRSYERADRVYNAMLARGYQGELLTLTPHRMSDRDWNYLLAGLIGLFVIQLIARLLP